MNYCAIKFFNDAIQSNVSIPVFLNTKRSCDTSEVLLYCIPVWAEAVWKEMMAGALTPCAVVESDTEAWAIREGSVKDIVPACARYVPVPP
jgi:hypothetical protein